MNKTVRRATRVLAVGTPGPDARAPLDAALAGEGRVILMEEDQARADEARRSFASAGLGDRAVVIGGDPRRLLYKLAGPFDVILCSPAHLALRPALEKLLAPGGVLMARDA